MPSKVRSLFVRKIAAEQGAPANFEYRPFRLLKGGESITRVTDGISGRHAEPSQAIGRTLALLNEYIVASERLAAHTVQHTLQFSTVPAMRLRAELAGYQRNILTKFVHEAPLDCPAPLDYERRQLICGEEPSQLGAVTCGELTASRRPTLS